MTKCDLRRFFPLVLIISPQKFHCLLFKVLGVTENFLKFFIFLFLSFILSFLFFFPLWANKRVQTTRSYERPRKKNSQRVNTNKRKWYITAEMRNWVWVWAVSVKLMPWLLLQRTIHLGWLALLWCNSVSCCMVSKM